MSRVVGVWKVFGIKGSGRGLERSRDGNSGYCSFLPCMVLFRCIKTALFIQVHLKAFRGPPNPKPALQSTLRLTLSPTTSALQLCVSNLAFHQGSVRFVVISGWFWCFLDPLDLMVVYIRFGILHQYCGLW